MPHKSARNDSAGWRRALFGVYNARHKGDFRALYYERGRKPRAEGGTGRWATTVTNTTGVGARTVVAGADGTGTAVYQRPGYRPSGTAPRRVQVQERARL